MKRLAFLAAALLLGACHEHITLTTDLWHSEKCHPDIWYRGNPPNASPECEWTQVYPPGAGYRIK